MILVNCTGLQGPFNFLKHFLQVYGLADMAVHAAGQALFRKFDS